MPWWGWLLIGIGVLLIAAIIVLYIVGTRLQKKQAEAEKQMDMTKQSISILVIDKQKKKMTEAGLPEAVIEQTPKYARRMKVPVVKCKVGPRIMVLIADQKVYDIIPVKKTCTVMVSGIYITELKSVRGGSVPKIPEKKKGFLEKMREKAAKAASKQ